MEHSTKPLAIDLFCGLGGWTEGFLAEGWRVVGFDVERHVSYPGQLVLQDVLTLDGCQFRDAACVVASPPCQAYSYMAMPWSRAKRQAEECWPDSGAVRKLNALFDACFRIQREASAASGRHIPMVVENVKGAQPWVGRAAWHYGSYYLWGDVPALMPHTLHRKTVGHVNQRDGYEHTRHLTNPEESDAVKQRGSGAAWFDKALDERQKEAGKGSTARKVASALIAKIPFELACHVARCFKR